MRMQCNLPLKYLVVYFGAHYNEHNCYYVREATTFRIKRCATNNFWMWIWMYAMLMVVLLTQQRDVDDVLVVFAMYKIYFNQLYLAC